MQGPVVSPFRPAVYTWTSPNCPVKVSVDLGLVANLQSVCSPQEQRPLKLQQGLLLGEIANGVTRIADYQPVSDLAGEMMAAARRAGRSMIGFYRARSGDNREPLESEIILASSVFQRRGAVVLLVSLCDTESRETDPAKATFFFFDGTTLRGGYTQFPFDAATLAQNEFGVPPLSAEEVRKRSPATMPRRAARPPERLALPNDHHVSGAVDEFFALAGDTPRPSRWGWRHGLAIALFAVGAIACSAVLTRVYRTPPVANSTVSPAEGSPKPFTDSEGRIELHAQRQGADLQITWAGAVGSPDSTGILSITDGTTHRLLPLESDQVRFGSVLYAPVSDQVRVELTISHGNQVEGRGSVLVLNSRAAPRVVPQDVARATPREETPSEQPVQQRGPVRPFAGVAAARQDRRPAADIELPAPPLVSERPPAQAPLASLPLPLPLPSPAAPPPSAPAAPLETVLYAEAVPVYKAIPTRPPELRAMLGREPTVRVKVQIDEKGRVSKADPVRESGTHQLLEAAALRAALAWRFTPAHMGTRPVKSEMTLEFRFRSQ